MLCSNCGRGELVGPYCPVCLTHADDPTLVNLPAVQEAVPVEAPDQPWTDWLLFVAFPLLMIVGAAVALVWHVPNLWLLLVPTACVTLVCGLRSQG